MNTYVRSTALGALASISAIWFAANYFASYQRMAATALISIGLVRLMAAALENNRHAIWVRNESPWGANFKLTMEMLSLFLGIFFTTSILAALNPESYLLDNIDHSDRYSNEFIPLLVHNATVLVACFIFGLIYHAGGLMLVLAWNALNWSLSLVSYFVYIRSALGISSVAINGVIILPHLIFEVSAYVLAGLAGVFLQQAIVKYSFTSTELFRVSRACIVILAASAIVITLAVSLEVFFAQAFLLR